MLAPIRMNNPLHLKFPFRKRLLLFSSLLSPVVSALAAPADASSGGDSALSNPVFVILFGVFVLLFVIIIVLASVVSNIAKGLKPNPPAAGKIVPLALLLLTLLPFQSHAADAAEVVAVHSYGGISPVVFWSMIGALAFEIAIISVLFFIISNLIANEERTAASVAPAKAEPSLLERLNDSVSLDKEKDILMDHNYDGIRELDNNLPPWWKYGFYFTILFAFVYLIHYHLTKTGDLQLAEYKNEQKAAEAELAERAKDAKNLIDEHSVVYQNDDATLSGGKDLFTANCAACHLPDGGGIVGPNLTDDYWLHGGKINDIFSTIKYGYPEKGMKSWKDDFSPAQIAMLASFVKSLHGTHPATPKEPQGELYKEGNASGQSVKQDSALAKKDSLPH